MDVEEEDEEDEEAAEEVVVVVAAVTPDFCLGLFLAGAGVVST